MVVIATLTVYSDVADTYLISDSATYSTARSGGGTVLAEGSAGTRIGQLISGNYFLYEGFFSFDTSALTADATVSAAVLSLYGSADASTTDFTMTALPFDWGTSVTAADWVPGATAAGLTVLATFATSGFSTAAYNDFTDVAMPANVNKTGSTRLVICSDRFLAGTTPTNNERVTVFEADEAGTTKDPKLVITYTLPTSQLVMMP